MQPTENKQRTFGGILGDAWRDYYLGLKNLATCPHEIWVAYLVKVLESVCYFSSVLILMQFLTEDMELSDLEAGTVFGVFSASMSFFTLFVGFIADSMGIKRALLTGLVISLVGRLAITFTTEPWIVYPGLIILSVGFAYMIPLVAAAVKLFSTKRAQKYAYSWYYVVMNVGALIAGLSRDWLLGSFTEDIILNVAGVTLAVRPLQIVFLVCLLTTFFSLVLVGFFVRGKIPMESYEKKAARGDPKPTSESEKVDEADGAERTEREQHKSAWRIMIEVTRERMFWIFILFIFLLVLVKMIFQYNHSLYPLYMERVGFGDWTGKLYAINPAIIIILVPVMTAITGQMKSYNCIMLGSFIAASSVFVLGFGESIMLIVMFQVILSIGEAIYSPRIYEYTASIAPEGREASYMAYSKAPMFFAKVAAGPATGILLFNLCPESGARNTELMWIIVGVTTMVSPVMLLLGRRWLDVESRRKRGEELG